MCLGAALTGMVASVPVGARAAQIPPAPESPLQAQWALGFNPKKRCPELQLADAGTRAVVVFWLPSSGIPSHISIKTSSGLNALDSATISCVSRLRFAAATTLGSGDPIDSWQQIALSWASRAPEPIAGAPTEMPVNAKQDDSGQSNDVTVRVCVDEAGQLQQAPKIVHSSGMAALDQAAVKIAASGSAYYRPDTTPNGPPTSGCAQLAIKFDMK